MRFDPISAETNLYLTKADIAALATFASKDKTRPHLASICVDPSLGRVVATDGHRLVLARAAWKKTAPRFLVPAAELAKAAKLIDAKGEVAISATRGDDGSAVVRVTAGGTVASFAAPTEQFPPVDQILELRTKKSDNVADRIGLNAKYLNDILLVQRAAEIEGVWIEAWNDVAEPIWFEARNAGIDVTWIGCIMPMRL